jgi:hypothetical protein
MEKKDSDMEIKNVKSWIIFLLLENPIKVRDLKDKLIFERKLQLKDFYYHMNGNGKKEWGLKSSKIVKEKNGILFLNLESFESIVKIIEILLRDDEIGPRMEYLFHRAFVEAFYYYQYGDSLNLFYSNLDRFLESKISLNLFSDISFYLEITERIFKFQRFDKNKLKYFTPDELKEIDKFMNKINFLDLLVEYAEKKRGNFSIEFKLAYIINVIYLSLFAEWIENEKPEALPYVHISQMTLSYKDNDYILDSIKKIYSREIDPLEKEKWEKAINIFIEKVLKKAFDNNLKTDYSLSGYDMLLDLYEGFLELFLHNFQINFLDYFQGLYYGNLDKIVDAKVFFKDEKEKKEFQEKRKQFFKNDDFFFPNF